MHTIATVTALYIIYRNIRLPLRQLPDFGFHAAGFYAYLGEDDHGLF